MDNNFFHQTINRATYSKAVLAYKTLAKMRQNILGQHAWHEDRKLLHAKCNIAATCLTKKHRHYETNRMFKSDSKQRFD